MISLTSNASEQLMGYALDVAVGKRSKVVRFEKIEYTRVHQAHGDANMTLVVEAVSGMDASISVFWIIIS